MKLQAFPTPWTVSEDEFGGWIIRDADGKEVMYCAEFTGDGATISMSAQQAAELCAIVNWANQ